MVPQMLNIFKIEQNPFFLFIKIRIVTFVRLVSSVRSLSTVVQHFRCKLAKHWKQLQSMRIVAFMLVAWAMAVLAAAVLLGCMKSFVRQKVLAKLYKLQHQMFCNTIPIIQRTRMYTNWKLLLSPSPATTIRLRKFTESKSMRRPPTKWPHKRFPRHQVIRCTIIIKNIRNHCAPITMIVPTS